MPSFEADIHGPDEEVGLYQALVHFDYTEQEGEAEFIHLRVEPFRALSSEKFPLEIVELVYHLPSRNYIPVKSEYVDHELYSAILLMLEETLGSSWGYTAN